MRVRISRSQPCSSRASLAAARSPSGWPRCSATGTHNSQLLAALLAQANDAVRQVFHGPVTYASLPFETVNWSLFDFIVVDHYRDDRVKDRYADMLKPFFAYDKPVIVTEF